MKRYEDGLRRREEEEEEEEDGCGVAVSRELRGFPQVEVDNVNDNAIDRLSSLIRSIGEVGLSH